MVDQIIIIFQRIGVVSINFKLIETEKSIGVKMKIIFIGGIFPKEIEQEVYLNSITGVQIAADKLQKLILEGFAKEQIKTEILNNIFIGSYPTNYKKIKIKEFYFSYEGILGKNIKFYNIFLLKHIIRTISTTKELFKCLRKNNEENIKIFIYSAHTPFMIASALNKFIFKNIEICLMIPDLPIYMNTSIKKETFLKKLDTKIFDILLKRMDKFVLLTNQMGDFLKIKKEKYIVIEGMCKINNEELEKNIKSDKKVLLYTGTLNEKYGILDLIESFRLIKKENYELWICGKGDTEKKIIESSAKDNRIKYLGQIENSLIQKYQKNVRLLINPRANNEEFTKYSFPSKVMEYFSSGTPVLMKKLDGIPEEYYEYCYILEEGTREEMANKIVEVLEKNDIELKKKGDEAKKFIMNQKLNYIQTKKIINFFKRVNLND